MLKQIIGIIVLSILFIVGVSYAQQGVQLLLSLHDWIANFLKDIFSGGQAGDIIRQLIALLSIPVIVALIPAIIYWVAKRSWFPYFMGIIWVIWLIQVAALAVLSKS